MWWLFVAAKPNFEAIAGKRAWIAPSKAEQSWSGDKTTSKLAVRPPEATLTMYLAMAGQWGKWLSWVCVVGRVELCQAGVSMNHGKEGTQGSRHHAARRE